MPQKNILVVDDELSIRETMKSLLEEHGYSVKLADDGVSALSAIKEELPDLIISDIKMKDMDGYTLLQELKKRDLSTKIPVIVVTGYSDMQDLFSLQEVADYVVKPFNNEDLLLRIARILNK
ncbi:MAG: response regulator [Candidatus Gygaella obscura]|nr:response regulator [Candidatus Gygaella obscura]